MGYILEGVGDVFREDLPKDTTRETATQQVVADSAKLELFLVNCGVAAAASKQGPGPNLRSMISYDGPMDLPRACHAERFFYAVSGIGSRPWRRRVSACGRTAPGNRR